MSRQPGYQSSPARRPSGGDPQSPPNTRPLQISRPTRPTTPSNGSIVSSNPASPVGPSRPQRSELRARQISEYSLSDAASAHRPPRERKDSVSTTRSDASVHNSYSTRNGTSGTSKQKRPTRSGTANTVGSDDTELSPTSLATVMNAFQSAGVRKRTLDGDDDWDRERREAIAAEEQRQKRIQERVPGRRTNGKAKAGDVDAVLDQIKDEWEFVIDPDFNPVDLALQIIGDGTSGKDLSSFRRTKKLLSQALKGSVDKHYQAFAASLPHHTSLLGHLGMTQGQIKEARSALQEAKDSFGSKRADLVQMWTRGQTLEEMLRILDQIERLRLVPDVLESLMSEKRLLQAAVLLVRSLKTINKQDMLDIGAVADLRSYLIGQETALREILVDELHNHLYLKSFWCESRWATYTVNQQSMPRVEFEDEPLATDNLPQPSFSSGSSSPIPRVSRLSRYLHNLTLRPNDPPDDVEEQNSTSNPAISISTGIGSGLPASASVASLNSVSILPLGGNSQPQDINPESDSFTYLETLLESLAVLGKLGSALDLVAQRLPSEIFALVESTVDEVGERMEYGRRTSVLIGSGPSPHAKGHSAYFFASRPTFGDGAGTNAARALIGLPKANNEPLIDAVQLRLTALESSTKHTDHEVLRDLFWTVYSKLDAVMQGLRVVYEVANRIGSRRDFKDSSGAKPGSLFPLSEIWTPIQAEVRTLLYDYVTDEEQSAISSRNPISSINDILREGKFNRDKSKSVFRFADTDVKLSMKTLRPHEEELNRVLRDTVPGLVQGSTESAVQATLSSVGTDERLLGIDQHHRLLIKPDAFHVSVLFQPMLSFLERVVAALPSGSESARASSAVMEEFVLNVYLPQLEEKVSLLFHQAVTGTEAFLPDSSSPWLSKEPLVNASTQLMALIHSLCVMLTTSPFHRENYARLILTVVIQFYQRCSDRFHALVSSGPPTLGSESGIALGAQWAQNSELSICLSELYQVAEGDMVRRQDLCRRERRIEQDLLGEKAVGKGELVAPLRNLSALGNLYRSVAWFSTALNRLKGPLDDMVSPTSPTQTNLISAVTPHTFSLPPSFPASASDELKLPLSREMALRFHALLKTYDQLSELILHTMRVDIRCRVSHYLDLASRHGNYHIDREVGEPDPHIIDLNLELGECDDVVSTTLPEAEQRFVFEGIGSLMDQQLISTARNIRRANAFGINKIRRNMLALQQCVKTIARDPHDTEFENAKKYYNLFSLNPSEMLDGIRQGQVFTFDEYKVILDLQCGVDPGIGGKSATQATDRNYSMYVIDLHGMVIDEKSDDA
ncbi:Sec8 exocyst complex component-specific domain-containing protein [Amylostereum chailletii]|nr:Sec8 exocyst complex component-specific domain-containing protein [Amylostereum chailletii]